MSEIDEKLDAYVTAREALHAAFGYKENWVSIEISDERGKPWMIIGGEGQGGSCIWATEPFTAEMIVEGKEHYSGPIYTQRFLPKWVYRTPTHVMISVDTQTDGNKFLMIFDAHLECLDEGLRAIYQENW